MYGEINDTKHAKTLFSHPFGNLLDLSAVIHIFHYGAYEFKRHAFLGLSSVSPSPASEKSSNHAHTAGFETGNKTLFRDQFQEHP